ncbi:MAG: four-helix bundle copper-binding protein [Nitrosomonadales bacterium]|nr:four-helix bundle copper-binding protein [Nitrosomonadales bacterium]
MNRRELLTGAAAMVAAVTAGRAFAAEPGKMDHDHMGMGGMDMHHDHKATRNQKLIDAASDCVLKADICLQHCIVSMGEGDKTLAACAQSANQVAAVCEALRQMASAEAKHLPQLAKVVMEVCKDCEDECKKKDKHPECKACGEACAACYKECKAIAI